MAILVGVFVFHGFLPAWKTLNTDFRNYYVAARLYREGSAITRVYDFTWFQRQKDHQGIEPCLVGFVPDTLLSALPIVPLAGLPPLTAKRFWLMINLAFLFLSVLLLTQITQLGWRRILIVVFLAVEPLGRSFLYGQMHLFVLFLLVVAVWCIERDRPASAGASVALAAGLKLYPALFLVFFLRKRQWRAVAGTACGLAALAGISVYLFGWDVHRIYLREILPQIGRGENIDPYSPAWNSLTAFLHRAFIFEPELNPHPLFNAPYIYALVQPLCQAAIFLPAVWLLTAGAIPRAQAKLEWAAYAAMLMALSTGPTSYHLCVLILPAALALDSLLGEGRIRHAGALLAIYGMICFPWMKWASRNADGWHMLTASPRVYPLLALPIFLYTAILSFPLVRERWRKHRQEAWTFAAAFLLLAAVGTLQAFRHQRGEFQNYSRRVFTTPGSLLNREPAIGTTGLYFTRMYGGSPRFETWRWSGNQLASLPPAQDEFHPATAPALADVWVELAGPESNIVRFSNLTNADGPSSHLEVANAEQPSVSPDGKWLAFVREYRGRGELWIKRFPQGTGSPAGEERKMVEDSYDVWEAAFEPGGEQIAFTSAINGQPELFSVDIASARSVPLPLPKPARYPAYSPDGHWLAYSRCEQGTWHLYVADRASGSSRRLVQGDCNSISPAWDAGSRALVYATDCGRGLEMTALARIEIPQ